MAFCRLLTVLVLIHNAAGLPAAEVRSSIIGGHDAAEGKWPWMVHLNITSGREKWRCGGSILNNQWVLTAASCWDKRREPNVERSMAWVGSYKLQKAPARFMGIDYVISHPEYQALSTGHVNDIALIKLKKKLIFSNRVSPVDLPGADDSFGPSSECWITGWGYVSDGVPLPDPETLQELRIPIVPQRECQAVYPHLNGNILCAGDKGGRKDACDGDYGGPLVCRARSRFVQVGVMSYGSNVGCGVAGHPGIYTQVSKYLHFINDWIHRPSK